MIPHPELEAHVLRSLIRKGTIVWAGNRRLYIYGTLNCASGKRMKKVNRVFFLTEEAAIQNGYRPCGHCMKKAYQKWKERTHAADSKE